MDLESQKKSQSLVHNTMHADITKGTSEFEGWGTALKPANEPICLARKPLSEKTVAENVLKWKTGGINVDGCRIGINVDGCRIELNGDNTSRKISESKSNISVINSNRVGSMDDKWKEGRFPANIIFECICDEVIKGEKGEVIESNGSRKDCDLSHEWGYKEIKRTIFTDKGDIHTNPDCPCRMLDEQSVGASRFFYNAKVSKSERNMGLDGFEEKKLHTINQLDDRLRNDGTIRETPVHKNHHPTVKPVQLMSYLCRLITPENGIVLDPFMGSGSTGIAAQLEGFRFCGMEMDSDYFKIAEARINNYKKYRKFIKGNTDK